MPVFEYQALNQSGKESKGSIDAENMRTARQKLRTQGIFVTDIKESLKIANEKTRDIKSLFESNKISLSELAVATRQLATLLNAGLPLVNALQALAEQVESVVLKRIIIDLREKVQEGNALSKSLTSFPKAFPRLYINMVASGEASGTLDSVLENLADYLEAQQELKRKISSALFYPILMIFFCALVIVGLLMFVVPSIVEIFIKQGATLPLPTRILLSISNLLTSYWYLVIVFIALMVSAMRWYYKQTKGRENIDYWIFKMPVIGNLFRKINVARIARTLSTLLSSGVQLLSALDIVKNIVDNVHLARALENARDGVKEGRSLARELARSNMFPPMLIQMIAVGETSGKLEAMLAKAGKSYENESNAGIMGLTTLIEPIMMIFLGGIVFSIVIAVLLPMIDLITVIQK